MLRTGCTTFLIHFKPAFSKPLFSSVVPCNRGTCVHVCHSSFTFLLVLPFLSHFPTRRTIGLKARTQIAFGGSFELDRSEHKASLFRKAFVPSFLKISQPFFEIDLISHSFGRHLAIVLVLLVASWQFLLEFSPCESCYFSILAPNLAEIAYFSTKFF